MSDLEQLKYELIALRAFAIAIYSLSHDRSLIDDRAKHIYSKLAVQTNLDPTLLDGFFEEIKNEFNSLGYLN